MILELLLVSVILVTAYQGQLLLRRGGRARRTYGLMLVVDGLLALVSFVALRDDAATRVTDMLGAVALGGFVCLVLVPPILRDLARRALAADRLGVARTLLGLRELLQPGLGAREEREFVETVADVRAGRTSRAPEALRARRTRVVDPLHRRAIDERIVLTLLYARQWREALDYFERTLEAGPGPTSAQLLVEVVRAYGEEGELDKAGALLERLERSPIADEPVLAFLLARARMVFLAFVGRPADVEALVGPSGALAIMPPSARSYWIGLARLHAGDAAGARQALGAAVAASGRDVRARQIAAALLHEAETAPPSPRAVPVGVAELADRIARSQATARPAPAIPRLEGLPWRTIPVTTALVATNLLVALLFDWRMGSTQDIGALAGAGANWPAAVWAGEWWRLHASTFLHGGPWHLILNMYGLWILGKLVEQFLGSARFFALYTLSGVGGALASVVAGGGRISVGASGAVLGLLGAAIAELGLRRQTYHEGWRRAVFKNLVFLAVAQLFIGTMYPQIDQAAHVGGLFAGALGTIVLAPRGRVGRTRPARLLTAALLAASFAAAAWSVVGVATSSYAATLERAGTAQRNVGGVSLETPRLWTPVLNGSLMDATFGTGPTVDAGHQAGLTEDLETVRDSFLRVIERDGDARDITPVAPSFGAPAGWVAGEWQVAYDLPFGRRRYHYAVFVKAVDDGVMFVTLFVPEDRIPDLRSVVDRMLRSARPAG